MAYLLLILSVHKNIQYDDMWRERERGERDRSRQNIYLHTLAGYYEAWDLRTEDWGLRTEDWGAEKWWGNYNIPFSFVVLPLYRFLSITKYIHTRDITTRFTLLSQFHTSEKLKMSRTFRRPQFYLQRSNRKTTDYESAYDRGRKRETLKQLSEKQLYDSERSDIEKGRSLSAKQMRMTTLQYCRDYWATNYSVLSE